MTTRSMMNERIRAAGKIPAGNYIVKLSDVILKEDVSLYDERLPQELRNKEKSTLTEAQIKQIDTFDLGDKGFFADGSPKPRYQNQMLFVFKETSSGKEFPFDAKFYGGPALSSKALKFLATATGKEESELIDKPLSDLADIEFNATITDDGNYNHIVLESIRKVGLPPIVEESEATGADSNGWTENEKLLLAYLKGEGAGMRLLDMPKLCNKGIAGLDKFDIVMPAWNGLKKKVKSVTADNETVAIVE